MLRYLLLAMLRDGTPDHGYGLMKEYRAASGVKVSIGNVYRELQRLASLGWVRAVPRAHGADPRRLPYQIADAGTLALQRWLTMPAGLGAADAQDNLSLRAFVVAAFGGEPGHLRILEQWSEDLAVSARLLQRSRALGDRRSMSGRVPADWALAMLAERRLAHMTIEIDFLRTFVAACNDHRVTGRGPAKVHIPGSRAHRSVRREAVARGA